MAIEDIGLGAGAGGLLGAILTFIGIKQRLDRQDKDIEKINDGTVWRSTCHATHKAIFDDREINNQRLYRIETKIDQILEKSK